MVKSLITFQIFICSFVFTALNTYATHLDDRKPFSAIEKSMQHAIDGRWEVPCHKGEEHDDSPFYEYVMVVRDNAAVISWKSYVDDQCETEVQSDEGWYEIFFFLETAKRVVDSQGADQVFNIDGVFVVRLTYQCPEIHNVVGVFDIDKGSQGKFLYFGGGTIHCIHPLNRPTRLKRERTGVHVYRYKGPFEQSFSEYKATLKQSGGNETVQSEFWLPAS